MVPGAYVQGSLTEVPTERWGFLGQEHMARELTGPQSNRKSLGNTESEARKIEPCSSVQQLTALLKPARANIKPAKLRNLVAGVPQRESKCLAINENHIGRK